MTVAIVTDSISDLPRDVAQELGITIIPLNVSFGTETYRDSIDITADDFYTRLVQSKNLPVTSAPSPGLFAETYDSLAENADEILVVTLSGKLSSTYEVALKSRELMEKKCQVEVLDSRWAAMAEGFIALSAARAAQAGAGLDDVMEIAQSNIRRVGFRAAFDTLEYLKRGGRIGKAQALLGSILNIQPIIGMKDGEVVPEGRERSRSKALEQLYRFAMSFTHIEEVAVEYAANANEAEMMVERLSRSLPQKRIHLSRTTPVIGTHTGPGIIVVTVLGDRT